VAWAPRVHFMWSTRECPRFLLVSRRLVINSGFLLTGLIGSQLLLAVIYAAAAREMSPGQFGVSLGALGVCGLIAALADFGVNALTVRRLAAAPDDTRAFADAFATRLGLAVFIAPALTALSVAVARTDDLYVPLLPLGLFVGASLLGSTLTTPLRSAERMHAVAAVSVVERILGLGAFVLLSATIPAVALTGALTLGAAGAAASTYLLVDPVFKHTRTARPSPRTIIALWRLSAGFGLANVAGQAQRIDVALVGLISGPTQAGVYALPARLAVPLYALPAAYSAALYPRVAAGSGRKSHLGGVMIVGLVMLPILAGVFIFAPLVVQVIGGSAYVDGAVVLRLYSVAVFFSALNQPLAAVLQAQGSEAFVAMVVTVGSVLGLLAVAVGASVAGAGGAATGFLGLQAFALLAFSTRLKIDATRKGAD
jgi:O-antigen/teichoic acid export membrane protein